VPLVDTISTKRLKDGGLKNHLFDQQPSTMTAASDIADKRTFSKSDNLRIHRRLEGHERVISAEMGGPSTLPPGGPLGILTDAATLQSSPSYFVAIQVPTSIQQAHFSPHSTHDSRAELS
jgi:hypothetical protein